MPLFYATLDEDHQVAVVAFTEGQTFSAIVVGKDRHVFAAGLNRLRFIGFAPPWEKPHPIMS